MNKFPPRECDKCFTNRDKENIHDLLFKDDLHLFDTSNYPKDHKCFSNDSKKVVGKFNDECGGQELSQLVGFRSTM